MKGTEYSMSEMQKYTVRECIAISMGVNTMQEISSSKEIDKPKLMRSLKIMIKNSVSLNDELFLRDLDTDNKTNLLESAVFVQTILRHKDPVSKLNLARKGKDSRVHYPNVQAQEVKSYLNKLIKEEINKLEEQGVVEASLPYRSAEQLEFAKAQSKKDGFASIKDGMEEARKNNDNSFWMELLVMAAFIGAVASAAYFFYNLLKVCKVDESKCANLLQLIRMDGGNYGLVRAHVVPEPIRKQVAMRKDLIVLDSINVQFAAVDRDNAVPQFSIADLGDFDLKDNSCFASQYTANGSFSNTSRYVYSGRCRV